MQPTRGVQEEVEAILIELHGFDRDTLIGSAHLIHDLNLDSLEIAEFMIECEKRFDISIPEDVERGLLTVSEVVTHIEGRKNISQHTRMYEVQM